MPETDLRGTPAARDLALDELANRIFFRLYQCANMMHKTGTRALEEQGVTTQQWAVIGALSRPQAREGMSVGDLARFLMVSRQNITGVLERLESQGYVERARGAEDGRTRLLRLTAGGERLWQEIVPPVYRYYEGALRDFSFRDRTQILHHLEHLLDNMRDL